MKTLRLLAPVLALFVSARSQGQSARSIARLDSLFDVLEKSEQMLGSVALSKGGRVFYSRSVGPAYEKNGTPVPANAQTMYRIGSITKMFTAVLVMQAVEEGKLSLDAKLSDFFPNVPNASVINIRHMLTHRSGLTNYTDDSSFLSYYQTPQTEAQMIARFEKQQPAFFPDSASEYSNTNYVLLGYIIQKVRGKSYEELVPARILQPLGMTRTKVNAGIVNASNEASSFSWEGGKWVAESPWEISVAGAAGNITSTTTDLLLFINGLFTGKLLKPETVVRMQQPGGPSATEARSPYGLGMFPMRFGGRTAWGHNGGIENFHSNLAYFPADSIGMAILLNGERYDLNTLGIAVLSAVYDVPFSLPNFNAKSVDVAESILKRYEGTYFSKDFPLKIFIRAEEGKLIGRATGQMPFGLEATSETEFRFEDAGIQLRFSQGADGQWNTMHFQQKGARVTFTKEI